MPELASRGFDVMSPIRWRFHRCNKFSGGVDVRGLLTLSLRKHRVPPFLLSEFHVKRWDSDFYCVRDRRSIRNGGERNEYIAQENVGNRKWDNRQKASKTSHCRSPSSEKNP